MSARIVTRFATSASRFRCAVTGGFAIVIVGALTFGAGSAGFADDIFGGLGSLFGAPSYPQYSQPSYAPEYTARPKRYVRRAAAKLTVRLASARHGDAHSGSVRAGGLSMCVRSCDGFAFPVGTYHGESDRASHEATCQSECPGASTSLYVLPGRADTIGDAVEVKSGRAYSQTPTAFHYMTFLQESCSCHPREGNRVSSLLHDFTLRRGDAIMTRTGFKVFHGGDGHFPHRQGDFVALSTSKDVRDRQRATFHAIERASQSSSTTVARGPSQVPTDAAAKTMAVPALEKQASLAPVTR